MRTAKGKRLPLTAGSGALPDEQSYRWCRNMWAGISMTSCSGGKHEPSNTSSDHVDALIRRFLRLRAVAHVHLLAVQNALAERQHRYPFAITAIAGQQRQSSARQ